MKHGSTPVRGFSLTELLVAMVIGLLLLGGLVALMASSKKNYAQQDYSARLQENARFAMQFLAYDIRMAGFFGCSNEIVNDTDILGVTGTAGEITIRYGEPYDAGEEIIIDPASYDPYDTPLTLALNEVPDSWDPPGDDTWLVLADCGGASVARLDTIPSSNTVTLDVSDTSSDSLGRTYNPALGDRGPTTVRRLITNTYTIQNLGESNVPVLMRNGQELVEGVENIQLLYQDISGGTFVNDTTGLTRLAAVQLGALVRSVSNENLDDREYGSGADITVDAGGRDGCDAGEHRVLDQCVAVNSLRGQRRVFTSAHAVRNRSL